MKKRRWMKKKKEEEAKVDGDVKERGAESSWRR